MLIMNPSDMVRISANYPFERDIVLVAGFPGSGLVGSIAVNYLVEKFEFTLLGYLTSPNLPINAAAINGLAHMPVRIYEKGNLVALVSDVPIPDEAAYEISVAVIDWLLKRARLSEIVVLGGVVTGGTGERVFGAATTEEALEHLKVIAEILPNLNITGVIGGILSEAMFRNIPAYGLLIETNFDVDPRASAAGLTALSNLYHFNIDVTELIQQADTVEPMLLRLAEDVKNSQIKPISYEDDVMYG